VTDVGGLEPQVPPWWTTVTVLLPLQVGDDDNPMRMFAFAAWPLPRAPTIGEEIAVDAISKRVRIERVWWDSQGRVGVRLQEVVVRAESLEALERDGWTVAAWEDEPPSDWLDN
jgi:hypothetical protein